MGSQGPIHRTHDKCIRAYQNHNSKYLRQRREYWGRETAPVVVVLVRSYAFVVGLVDVYGPCVLVKGVYICLSRVVGRFSEYAQLLGNKEKGGAHLAVFP